MHHCLCSEGNNMLHGSLGGGHGLLFGLDPSGPRNVLTFFVNVALVIAPIGIKESFATAFVETNQQMGAVVSDVERHVMLL
jgi:hypothetical protein